MSEKPEVRQNEAKDQPLTPKHSPSPVDDLREEELAALTGKEQLKVYKASIWTLMQETFKVCLGGKFKSTIDGFTHGGGWLCLEE